MALETHLFDWDGDLYGREMQVHFVAPIRPEQRFDDLASLKHQIQIDQTTARALLAS